jgi:hypothetical protein
MNSIECKYMYCTAFVLKNLNGVLATSYMHKKNLLKTQRGRGLTLEWLEVVWRVRSRLGDGSPTIHYFFNSPFDTIKFVSFQPLTLNTIEFAKLF